MVKIRLRRVGAKKQPHYRVVVTDSRSPRDGKFIEVIGHYNPRTEPPTVEIDGERALYWLSVGAQPTAAVHRMLDKLGILARFEAHKLGELPIEEPEIVSEEEVLAGVADVDQAEEEAEPAEPEQEAIGEYSEEDQDEGDLEEEEAQEDEGVPEEEEAGEDDDEEENFDQDQGDVDEDEEEDLEQDQDDEDDEDDGDLEDQENEGDEEEEEE